MVAVVVAAVALAVVAVALVVVVVVAVVAVAAAAKFVSVAVASAVVDAVAVAVVVVVVVVSARFVDIAGEVFVATRVAATGSNVGGVACCFDRVLFAAAGNATSTWEAPAAFDVEALHVAASHEYEHVHRYKTIS